MGYCSSSLLIVSLASLCNHIRTTITHSLPKSNPGPRKLTYCPAQVRWQCLFIWAMITMEYLGPLLYSARQCFSNIPGILRMQQKNLDSLYGQVVEAAFAGIMRSMTSRCMCPVPLYWSKISFHSHCSAASSVHWVSSRSGQKSIHCSMLW